MQFGRLSWRFGQCLLGLLLLACPKPPSPTSVPLHGVRIHGCAEVTEKACWIEKETVLTLWVPKAEGSAVQILIDEVLQPAKGVAVQEGLRLKVKVPPEASSLGVVLPLKDAKTARWELALTAAPQAPRLGRAKKLRGQGKFREALALLKLLLNHESVWVRAKAIGLQGRITMAKGDYEAGLLLLGQSIEMLQGLGAIKGEISTRSVFAFVEHNKGRYVSMLKVLEPAFAYGAVYQTGADLARYYEGLAAIQTNDYGRALHAFDLVLGESDRLGLKRRWLAAAQIKVRTLKALGRAAEARQLLSQVVNRLPEGPACRRAYALEVTGGLLSSLHEDSKSLDQAQSMLHEASDLFAGTCPQPRWHASVLVALGSVALQQGHLEEAKTFMKASNDAFESPGIPVRLAQLQLSAAIAQASKAYTEAADTYLKLSLLGALLGSQDLQWRGHLGQGIALHAKGKNKAAIKALQKAEKALDEAQVYVPFGEGRDALLQDRKSSARLLIHLLLQEGQAQEAALVARKSHVRALWPLAQTALLGSATKAVRQRWSKAILAYRGQRRQRLENDFVWGLSAQKLRKLRALQKAQDASAKALLDEALKALGQSMSLPKTLWEVKSGELLLAFHESEGGWAVFAMDDEGLVAKEVPVDARASPQKLAESLLGAVLAKIKANQRLKLVSFGVLHQVDFHALPFQGAPLVSTKSVVYSVGIPAASAPEDTFEHAYVMAPYASLKQTQQEAQMVKDQLSAQGFDVRSIQKMKSGSTELMRMWKQRRPGWFHYAGHAQYRGRDGWQSYLGTEARPIWTIGDIVAMEHSPLRVVLSGCETAQTSSVGASSLGLAQAFVLAGSKWVIAASRPIKDTEAQVLVGALYGEQNAQVRDDPGAWLAGAQREILKRSPQIDWPAFRVLVP